MIYDEMNGRVAIFEAKYSKQVEQMDSNCNRAIEQINERMYAEEYRDDYDQILCYGIAFSKRDVSLRKTVKSVKIS